MNRMRVCTAVLAGLMLIGCRTQPKAQVVVAADDSAIARVRESFKRIDPESQVGPVIAAVPEDRLVAVGDVPVKEFTVGELLMFVDSDQNPLVSGTVTQITGDALHVRYDPPAAGRRVPNVGDLAVKVK